MDSGSELGLRGDGAAARAKRKWAVLPPAALAAWNAQASRVMAAIAAAKYAESAEARAVLKATGRAQLWHLVPRGQPVRFVHLEAIRAGL
jgi:hypothetical protein